MLQLAVRHIVETVRRLCRRIEERFPGSSLGNVCAALLDIAEKTRARLEQVQQPILWLRTGTWVAIGIVLIGAGIAARAVFGTPVDGVDSFTALQAIEAGIQNVVFIGFGLVFLITAEERLQRRRALGFIRELRAVAHIVDMHQLTKDPDQFLVAAGRDAASPERTLTRQELGWYLDSCSELLSLCGKLAALYAERFSDGVVLQAVDQVEDSISVRNVNPARVRPHGSVPRPSYSQSRVTSMLAPRISSSPASWKRSPSCFGVVPMIRSPRKTISR